MNVAQVTTMREDIPLIDRIAPWEGSTQESADYHKAKMLAERKASGLDENGEVIPMADRPRKATVLTMPIASRSIPWDSQLDCDEAIDLAVETYGLEAVVRALRLVAATNGVLL